MTTQKDIKLQHYYNDARKALYHYYISENVDEARMFFRRSAEAYMKYRLYDVLNETFVTGYLTGIHNIKGVLRNKPHRPDYSTIHKDLQTLVTLGDKVDSAIDAMSYYANVGAHDADQEISDISVRSDLSMLYAQSQLLTVDLYKLRGEEMPTDLNEAYTGNVDESVLHDYTDFSDVLENCDNFDKSNRYILISPADHAKTSVNQKKLLSRIPWSFILDFDPTTKGADGLFTAFGGDADSRIVPMTIEQYQNKTLAVSNSKGRLNWLFANGLQTIDGTVATDYRTWIAKKYDKFIRFSLREFVKDAASAYYVVCLSQDKQYVKNIINSLHDIDELQPDLVHFVFISCDDEILASLKEEAESFSFVCHSVNMDVNIFLLGIGETLAADSRHNTTCVVVPAKADDGSKSTTDISDIAPRLLDGGIEVVHSTIGEDDDNEKTPAETFYRGENITWHELSQGVEANRNVYENVVRKVRKKLSARLSSIFTLCHAAGAGGSTLSRKLAYEHRKEYPVILLNKYVKGVTEETLQLLYNRVKTPVLAIVEASEISLTTIELLIQGCNACKQTFLFVFVQRNAKKSPSEDTEYLNDAMLDIDEKNRFLLKVESYGTRKDLAESLKKMPANKCEVIDFSLAISENHYETTKLQDYVKYYTHALSAPLNEFVLYVCMIYHYSQKSVSDLVFRNLFTKDGQIIGLSKYLRTRNEKENKAFKKLLVPVEGQDEEIEGWRPRYASFGTAVLDTASAKGWKDILYNTSLDLIKCVRSNQEFLTDDVRKMFVRVFLERGTGDVLGVEEEWRSSADNNQFSVLMAELGYSETCQSSLLKCLANSYPNEPHFWGHLARFTYEKAKKPDDFEQAMEYMYHAFEANGEDDYTLQHIAGMCKRRLLEYYKRENKQLDLQEIKELVEESRSYFAKSRQLNSKNVHAYISEIQLIAILIEYGKSFSPKTTYQQFLFNIKNSWYLEQYVSMLELLDEVKILMRQMKTLGDSPKTTKSFRFLHESESRSILFKGDVSGMLAYLIQALDKASLDERPRLRHMYVRYLLLSKVNCEPTRIDEAWDRLNEKEKDLVGTYLDRNIAEKNTDVFSLRYWFMFVRKCRQNTPIEEVLSRLEMLKKESEGHPLLHLEACYNIFILKAFSIIHDEDFFEKDKVKEIKELNMICHQLSVNDKFIYDILVNDKNIGGIMPYKKNFEFSQCLTFHGTITSIYGATQGEIKLDCGLTAFFVPSRGGFVRGRDETKEVIFAIGFRHDGLIALQVRSYGQEEPASTTLTQELAEENGDRGEAIDSYIASPKRETNGTTPKQEFKIIDKIDLTKIPKK